MIVDGIFYQHYSEASPLYPLLKLGEGIMTYPSQLDRQLFVNNNDPQFKRQQEEVYLRPNEPVMLKREGEDFLVKQFGRQKEVGTDNGYQIQQGHVCLIKRVEVLKLQVQLESFFGTKCQLLGDFLYPPGGFRTWHTNRYDVPKNHTNVWAVFFVFTEKEGDSFFRFIHPESGEMVTAWDKRACANIFRVSSEQLIWHCIRAEATSRWSVGFHLPDNWQEALDV